MIAEELQRYLQEARAHGEAAVAVEDLIAAQILIVNRNPEIHELFVSAARQFKSGFNVEMHHASSFEEALRRARAPELVAASIFVERELLGDVRGDLQLLADTSDVLQQVVVLVEGESALIDLATDGEPVEALRQDLPRSLLVSAAGAHLLELKLRFNLLQSFADLRSCLSLATDLASLHKMASAVLAQLSSFFEVDSLLIPDLKSPATEISAEMTQAPGIRDTLRRVARFERDRSVESNAAELRLLASMVGEAHAPLAALEEASTLSVSEFRRVKFAGIDFDVAFATSMQESLVSSLVIGPRGQNRFSQLMRSEFGQLLEEWARQYEMLTLRELRAKLALDEQAARDSLRSAITEMVCGVAHEINTPLGVIRTASGVVADLLSDQDQLQGGGQWHKLFEDLGDASAMIESNVHRIGDLVERFRAVAVSQTPEPLAKGQIQVPLDAAIERIRAAHSILVVNRILEIDRGVEDWTGYPKRLEQVVYQLLENAAVHGYDRQRGMLEVRLRGRDLDLGRRYTLQVVDFGRGIAADDRRRVFDAFFTSSRGTRATGLGLAVVKSIVEDALCGAVRCTATPGGGSTFTVDFIDLAGDATSTGDASSTGR